MISSYSRHQEGFLAIEIFVSAKQDRMLKPTTPIVAMGIVCIKVQASEN
jgi:hypothetical protein